METYSQNGDSNGTNYSPDLRMDAGTLARINGMAGKHYRDYSTEEKAVAVSFAAACNNVKMAARECGVPLQTLRNWIAEVNRPLEDGERPSPITEMVPAKKADLADQFEELARKCVEAAFGKIRDAPLASTATTAAISVDKMRLLREQTTANVRTEAHLDISVEEAKAETAALMAEAIALYEALSPEEKAALLRQSQEAQGGTVIEGRFTDMEDGGDGEDDDGEDPETQTNDGVEELLSVGLNGTNRTEEHHAVVSY